MPVGDVRQWAAATSAITTSPSATTTHASRCAACRLAIYNGDVRHQTLVAQLLERIHHAGSRRIEHFFRHPAAAASRRFLILVAFLYANSAFTALAGPRDRRVELHRLQA